MIALLFYSYLDLFIYLFFAVIVILTWNNHLLLMTVEYSLIVLYRKITEVLNFTDLPKRTFQESSEFYLATTVYQIYVFYIRQLLHLV